VPHYKSKLEKGMGCLLETAGIPFSYEPTRLPYLKKHHYTPDFWLDEQNFFIETKGRFLPQDRTKHLLVRELNPHIDIRFVFQQPNNKLSKKSQTTYAEWCDKHGFLWSGKKLPKEWF
jgi:hypothetical protein